MKCQRKTVLLVAAVGLGACVILALILGLPGSKAPRIVFDSETIDFGEREEGEKTTCTFVFRNAGTETLILYAWKTSCGCLLAESSETTVQPGETSELTATYDTHGRNGNVSSTILLATNDPKAEVVKLTITGQVKKPYVYHPRSIDFGEAQAEQFSENTLVIARLTRREMEIARIETSQTWLKASLIAGDRHRQEGLSAGEYRVAVRIASDAPIGPIKEEIVVSVLMKSLEPARQIKIPVTGYVQGDLTYEPKTVFWGTFAPGQAQEATIVVRSNVGRPVGIRSVQSRAEQVRVALVEATPMSACIRVESKKSPRTDFLNDAVIIATDSETMPQIVVPVYARIVDPAGEAGTLRGKEVTAMQK